MNETCEKFVFGYFPDLQHIFIHISVILKVSLHQNNIYIVFLRDFSQFQFVLYYELLEKIIESKAKG